MAAAAAPRKLSAWRRQAAASAGSIECPASACMAWLGKKHGRQTWLMSLTLFDIPIQPRIAIPGLGQEAPQRTCQLSSAADATASSAPVSMARSSTASPSSESAT